jgi:hypothetical protein
MLNMNGDFMNTKDMTLTAILVFFAGMFVAVIISSAITIWAINTVFLTSIPFDLETILALAYLQFLVGSMIKGMKS